MLDFLRDLFARPGVARTVILLEADATRAPRQYEVRPGVALYAGLIGIVVVAAVLVAAAVVTPLRGRLVGPGADELRATAERNAARADALEDSLSAQVAQIDQLRGLILGEPVDSLGPALAETLPAESPVATPTPAPAEAPRADGPAAPIRLASAAEATLDGLRAPALLPLDGVVSRGFAPERGHFGLDLAADVGTPVRAIAGGTVVLADWTQDGGLTVAVQHASGYLSIYKHNRRLLRRAGERVAAREPVAESGNTGQVTSGPHLHVEVWRDSRVQNPASFFVTP